MRRARKVGNLRLKNHQSILDLRERGMRELRKATRATENAHALFALADKRERDEQKGAEAFYEKQAREGQEERVSAPDDEATFRMAHLGHMGKKS